MFNNETNSVALVTGAGRRIGAAIVRYLHARGMDMIIHYRTSGNEASALVDECNQQRANSACALACDFNHFDQLNPFIEAAANCWGRLDLIVHNASMFFRNFVGQTTEKEWDTLFESNLKAPFFLSQAAVPYLKLTKGSIIHITDIHAQQPMRDYSAYCVSKAGLSMLTLALAKELAPDIRVNAIAPGAILWPEKDNALDPATEAKIIERTALQRPGQPQDIARAIWFLYAEASFVTGHTLVCDGGRTLFCY